MHKLHMTLQSKGLLVLAQSIIHIMILIDYYFVHSYSFVNFSISSLFFIRLKNMQ